MLQQLMLRDSEIHIVFQETMSQRVITEGGSSTNSIGAMTISSGVGSIPTLSAVQATAVKA